MPAHDAPPGSVSEARERSSRRFDELQRKLVPQWELIRRMNHEEHSVVVVPSVAVPLPVPPAVLQAYEERMLFLLLLLRQARTRLIYLTSQPIPPEIVDYYLALMPGVIPSHARKRFLPVAVGDGSSRPLTAKLLERPRLLEHVRGLIPNPDTCHLVPFSTTELEKELALRLEIPMYGSDPAHYAFGTKSGGRRLFREEGVRCPVGREGVRTIPQVVEAIADIRREVPAAAEALVKLDDAFAGQGNAVVDLAGLPSSDSPEAQQTIEERVRGMRFEAKLESFESFASKLAERGGVVEQRIAGANLRSPSVQLRITPLGDVQIVSTHDQLLEGSDGQSYAGCVFPADPRYVAPITRAARVVGERLARESVLGRLAVDFVVVETAPGGWDVHAIEINLRKGGTTHPYLTLEFLTDGHYDAERGLFVAPSGLPKHYVASDRVSSTAFRCLTPDDLFEFAMLHELQFNQSTQTGIVFHMITSVTEVGRFGLTAVGDAPEQAADLFHQAREGLERDAVAARRGAKPAGG